MIKFTSTCNWLIASQAIQLVVHISIPSSAAMSLAVEAVAVLKSATGFLFAAQMSFCSSLNDRRADSLERRNDLSVCLTLYG